MTTATKRIDQMTTADFASMTTTELLEYDARIGNFLDKATTPDGRGYVANVIGRRREIRAELERRHEADLPADDDEPRGGILWTKPANPGPRVLIPVTKIPR